MDGERWRGVEDQRSVTSVDEETAPWNRMLEACGACDMWGRDESSCPGSSGTAQFLAVSASESALQGTSEVRGCVVQPS